VSVGIALVLVVAAAFLAARVAFDWLARRYLIVSGAEYVVLGILLGPQVSGLLGSNALRSAAPITTLALGWMGAIVGAHFYLADLVKVRGITYRLAFVESLLTLTTVSALVIVAIAWWLDVPYGTVWVPAVALGAIGTASASAGVAVMARRLGEDRPLVAQLRVSTVVNAFVAIVAFGLIVSIHHPDPHVISRPITPTEWMVITIAVGTVGGALFYLFLGGETHGDRLVISLGGAVVVVSGAATYLGLSPLVAGLFFGAMLANTAERRDEIVGLLESVERPLYFVLLVIAGATWRPPGDPSALAVVVLFIAARAAGKIGGARLAARANGVLPVMGPDWGRGLLGQGDLALAIAINYLYQSDAAVPDVVFTGAIVSVLLTDVMSARLSESVVVAAADRAAAPVPNDTSGALVAAAGPDNAPAMRGDS